jgi:hypothetical protein
MASPPTATDLRLKHSTEKCFRVLFILPFIPSMIYRMSCYKRWLNTLRATTRRLAFWSRWQWYVMQYRSSSNAVRLARSLRILIHHQNSDSVMNIAIWVKSLTCSFTLSLPRLVSQFTPIGYFLCYHQLRVTARVRHLPNKYKSSLWFSVFTFSQQRQPNLQLYGFQDINTRLPTTRHLSPNTLQECPPLPATPKTVAP